jgi:hypothetical protein
VGKRTIVMLALAIIVMAIVPAMAFASLTNEYGLNYAGQSACYGCHGPGGMMSQDASKFTALHAGFATPGLTPSVPDTWTLIRAAGNAPMVPGTAGAKYDGGGEYSVTGLNWVTLGNYHANSGTEYLFWTGSTDPKVMPYNLVEGLSADPAGEWSIAAGEPAGLYDVKYACQRCHMLGSTMPKATATTVAAVPNPAATKIGRASCRERVSRSV